MQRQDKLDSGVDERLLHLVINDGSTVSEHVQTLNRDEQAEFAEYRTMGRFVIRPSDELETQPRDLTEARQSTPEFAFIARRAADRDFVFQDVAKAREFVDLLDRLVGEDANSKTRQVWAREMGCVAKINFERECSSSTFRSGSDPEQRSDELRLPSRIVAC